VLFRAVRAFRKVFVQPGDERSAAPPAARASGEERP
jgi:hypothetical protein